MPLGPGKYDDLCTYVRRKSKARAALLVIIGGNKGEGFAVQADAQTLAKLPVILENMAHEIRQSLQPGKPT